MISLFSFHQYQPRISRPPSSHHQKYLGSNSILLAVCAPHMAIIRSTDKTLHQNNLTQATTSTFHDELSYQIPLFASFTVPNQHLFTALQCVLKTSHLRFSRPSREQHVLESAVLQIRLLSSDSSYSHKLKLLKGYIMYP